MKKTFSILRDENSSIQTKVQKSELLMSENLDLNWMAKFVLGKYRRTLNTEQMQNFTEVYSEFVIKSYSKIVRFYKREQILKVIAQTPISENEFVVKCTLNSPGIDPIKIDFAIRKLDDAKFKVFDIIGEGISLINSNQAEFANILHNAGFDGLLNDLKAKISSLKNNNGSTQ
ncbi:MAG: ABC transporter substrate-binding protein [Rickettsiaceae bacterium]|nr:ABC transporter substrate-binding protein [Rickettsiaceae bacterium]